MATTMTAEIKAAIALLSDNDYFVCTNLERAEMWVLEEVEARVDEEMEALEDDLANAEKELAELKVEYKKLKRGTPSTTVRYSYQQNEENQKAIAEKNRCGFCTITSPEGPVRTMWDIIKTNKVNCFDDFRYAEKYDDAMWYQARAEFLEHQLNKLQEETCDYEYIVTENQQLKEWAWTAMTQ